MLDLSVSSFRFVSPNARFGEGHTMLRHVRGRLGQIPLDLR
jgi:hypothetical protein